VDRLYAIAIHAPWSIVRFGLAQELDLSFVVFIVRAKEDGDGIRAPPIVYLAHHFRNGPHGVSKLTLTRQWAGGGAGSDAADGGGVAAAEAPIAVRGCTDRRERRGGRERDLRINGGGAN
jgi:hypothetical protein